MKLTPVDYDPFAPKQPRLVPVDYDPFSTKPTAKERENVRRGLNPDGTPLQPGAGHGERGVAPAPVVNNEPDVYPEDSQFAKDARRLAGDVTKTGIGAVVRGTGSAIEGLSKIGQMSQENQRRADARQKEIDAYVKDAMDWGMSAEEARAQALKAVPVDRSGIQFDPNQVAQELKRTGQANLESTSPQFQKEVAASGLEGDIKDPSSWAFKEGTTARGMLGQAVRIGGEMVPIAASAFIPGAGPLAAVGGAAGQSAQGAYEEQSQRILDMPIEELSKVPGYLELVKTMPPYKARRELASRVGQEAMIPAATIGAGSGLIPGGQLTSAARRATTRALGANMAGRAAGELPQLAMEGLSEVGETAGAIQAANATTGENRSTTEGSFENLVLGAAGAGPGVVIGSLTASPADYDRQAEALKAQKAVATTPGEVGTLDAGIALAEARAEKAAQLPQWRINKAAREAAKGPNVPVTDSGLGNVPPVSGELQAANTQTDPIVPQRSAYAPDQAQNAGTGRVDQDALDEAELRQLLADRGLDVEQDVSQSDAEGQQPTILPSRNMDESADDSMEPRRVIAIHGVKDRAKVDSISADMKVNGWAGRPILAFDNGNGVFALTGTHRLEAAKKAGVDVPIVYVDSAKFGRALEAANATYDDVIGSGDDRVADFLRAAGDTRAADLMDREISDSETPNTGGIESEELDPNDPVIARMLAEQEAGMARRETERREGPSDAISEGLRAVAQNPKAFRSRLYEGKTMGEIADEGKLPYSQRSQDPEYNANVYHFVVDQGAKGKNEARIHEGKNDVWVDVSDLKSGGGRGEDVYSAAFSLARNTGKNFIEDPRGLSDTAMYRRVVQELSGILKADDASNVPVGEFLASQRAGGPKTRPVPVDPSRKLNPAISERAKTTHANTVGEAMVRKRTDTGDKSPAPIGRNTLKLSALIETLGSVPAGSARTELVGKLRSLATGSDGLGGLTGILPSRSVENEKLSSQLTPGQNGRVSDAGSDQSDAGRYQRSSPETGQPGAGGFVGGVRANDGRRNAPTPDAIRSHIAERYGRRARKLLDSSRTKIVQSERDVSQDIRSRSEPLQSADGTIQGFYDQKSGDSYLIADNFKRIEDVGPVFLHEEGVHAGMKAILGDQFDAIAKRLSDIAEHGNAIDKAIVAKAKRRAERAGGPASTFNEEWIAYTVQLAEQAKQSDAPPTHFLKRWLTAVYSAMSAWAARNGFKDVSVTDLREIALSTLGHQARIEAKGIMPSRTQQDTITVDGKERSRLNSDGKPIAGDDEALTNFWRWFGESKVTDEQGRPKILYHGTPNKGIDKFIGAATFFADNKALAEMYGKTVMPVYLSLQNPLVTDEYNAVQQLHVEWQGNRVKDKGYDGAIYQPRESAKKSGIIDARYAQYVVFRSEQVKSAIGNRGTFSPSDDSILASRSLPDERINEARRTASAKRQEAASSLGVTGPSLTWELNEGRFEEGVKGAFNRLRESLQDKYLSVLGAQGDIEAVTGELIKESQNVYRRENLMHGRVSEQVKALHDRRVKPIKNLMKSEGVSLEAVEDFMEARFAEDRNKHIASINPTMQDGGSGMLTQDAKDFLDVKTEGYRSKQKMTPELRKKVEGIVSRLDTIRDETLAKQRDSGLITKEQYAALSQNRNYAPLRGKDGEEIGGQGGTGGGVDVRGKPFQKALGRGAGNRAKDIVANIIGDAERTITQAEKTRVGQTLLRLVLANPNKDVWEVEPVKVERKFSEAKGIVYDAIQAIDNDPGAVRVMVEGKPYKIVLKDKRMAAAIKNLGADQIGWVLRGLGAVNRYFSAILTRYNPAFVPINMIRDLGMGMIGIASEHGLKAASQATVAYLPAMRALWRDARGKAPSGQAGIYAKEFSEAGGRTGFHSYQNVEEITQQIRNELKSILQIVRDKDVGAIEKIARVYGKGATAIKDNALIKVIEDANDTIENAMRLSAFIARRKKGDSVEASAEYAKNITVNFNRRGHATSVANALFLFFNAATQGSARTFQLLKNPKVMGTMAGLASLQFVLASLAMGADDEDDDGLTAWEKIPDYEKERNLIFPIVGEENGRMKVTLVKVPMPYGINFFSYMGGRLAQAMNSKEESDTWKLANDLGAASIDAVSPVKFTGGTRGYLPYLANIFVSLGYNKNDFGDRITNEQPYSAYEVPRASLGRASTPDIYHKTAKALNRLGGGDEVTPPKIMANLLDWSPEDLKYLTEAFTGGIGRTTNQVYGLGQRAVSGLTVTTADVPVLKSIIADVDMGRATQGTYYERKETIARETARVRTIYDEQGKEAALEHIRKTPALAGMSLHRFKSGKVENKNGDIQLDAKPGGLYYTYKQAEKELSDITAELKSARQNDSLTTAERLKKIEELEKKREETQRKLNAKWRNNG